MRQPKYFVKGTKGNIEVSKGAFLSMQKRKKDKKAKCKLLNFNSNSYLVKQKIINKKVSIYFKRKKSIPNKKKNSTSPNFDTKSVRMDEKNCPDTIESQKTNNQRQIVPQVSDFCFYFQNQIPEMQEKITNNQFIECQKSSVEQKIGQNFDNFWRTSSLVNYNDETDHSQYFDENQCQQSTWSMINENVQAMALSLSLSVYDHLYGQKN